MTIISTSHQFIFVHLHKCGGSSIEEAKRRISASEVDRPFMHYEVTKPFANAVDFNDFMQRFMKRNTLGTLFDRLSENGQLIVDDVYKLEDADRIWAAFSDRTQIDIPPTHANKGTSFGKFSWSEETLQAVNEMHAIDYETFGYQPVD